MQCVTHFVAGDATHDVDGRHDKRIPLNVYSLVRQRPQEGAVVEWCLYCVKLEKAEDAVLATIAEPQCWQSYCENYFPQGGDEDDLCSSLFDGALEDSQQAGSLASAGRLQTRGQRAEGRGH